MSNRTFVTIHMVIFLLLLHIPLLSRAQAPAGNSGKRPTVGLVLSGGGAKGFAYVGLLRVIQEAGLPIDYIGGSSIGSIIGGLYAIGYHPDSIAKMIRSQHWDALLKDLTERKYVAYEEKSFMEKTIVTMPLKNNKIGVTSMYQGQEISILLNRFYSPAYKMRDFSTFQTPFLCIGTNLFTGESVILNKGSLPKAIRASMSIPGYFAPTECMDYYLVDGGVVNNYPVKEVKEMGAEIIVGGDVQSGLYSTREDLASLTAILDQITSFARVRSNEIGDSLTDLKIRIRMNYGMMDFEMYDSIMAVGERVARGHFAEIKALADSLNAIEYRPMKTFTATPLTSVWIDSLIFHGKNKLHNHYFKSIFGSYRHRQVPLAEIERDIRLTYGSGYFDKVTYELDYENQKTNMVIDAVEGGPGEISAGVHYDSDYGIVLLLEGAFRNVLGINSKLFTDINIAINPRIRVTYFKGLGGQGSLAAKAEFYTFKVDTYDGEIKANKFKLTNYNGSIFFNYNLRNKLNLRTGFEYEYFRFRQDIIIDSAYVPYEEFSSYGGVFLSLNADTRDRANYPTSGVKSSLKVEYVVPISDNWTQEFLSGSVMASFKFDQSIRLRPRLVLQPGIFAGAVLNSSGSPPIQHLFGIGGLTPDNYIESYVPFTGLNFVQKFGTYSLVARLKLQCAVYKKLYLIFRTDAGGNERSMEELFAGRNFLLGYGVTAGYDSFIGPLEFTVMGSNINKSAMVFLNLGYWF